MTTNVIWTYKGETYARDSVDMVKFFQRLASITQDGKFGPNTSAKLISEASRPGFESVASAIRTESRLATVGPATLRFLAYVTTPEDARSNGFNATDYASTTVVSGGIPWIGPAHTGDAHPQGASVTRPRIEASTSSVTPRSGGGLAGVSGPNKSGNTPVPTDGSPVPTNPVDGTFVPTGQTPSKRGMPDWTWGLIAVGGASVVCGGIYWYAKRHSNRSLGR